METLLILAVVFGLVIFGMTVSALLTGGPRMKRGCGRGCATCGNRNICHPEEKKESK